MNFTCIAPLAMLACFLMASTGHAEAIYRWVDDDGRTQFSDSVPEKYRAVATRTDSSLSDLPAQEQDEAKRQAAQLKARAERVPVPSRNDNPSPRLKAAASTSRPASDARSTSGCASWRRRFDVSRDCFAAFLLPLEAGGLVGAYRAPNASRP